MKNSKLIVIAFVLICVSSFGQTAKQKRAEREFNSFSFVKAINTYEKLVDTSFNKYYAMRKLGDSYIMLRQPEKALKIYEKAMCSLIHRGLDPIQFSVEMQRSAGAGTG